MTLDRRGFLKGAGAGVGLAALGSRADAFVNIAVPPAAEPGIDTVVVVMMENRSVDHFFGWVPDLVAGFDATQRATYSGVDTSDWGAGGKGDYAGCDYKDPAHGWDTGRAQKDEGFLGPNAGNDEFAVSYYEAADLPVYEQLVANFTTFDNYFCSIMASTYPNRYYMHSAQTGGMKNNDFPPEAGKPTGWDWPTIWDLLDRKGVSWAYYFSNLPAIGLWGPKYMHNARHISHYYEDALLGRLPAVSFVDPFFVVPEGLANDDHPHADIRLGQEFVSGVTTTFMRSPQWQRGALFLNYDEWGGFWDHVLPPEVDDPRSSDGFGQLGFRTPALLISPFARGPRVDHGLYDHTSILRFIETNWGLGRLSELDSNARTHDRNIGTAIDLTAFDPEVDIDALTYIAPPEARIPCDARGHTAPASDLYVLAENGWLEAMGYRLDWRFADSIPW